MLALSLAHLRWLARLLAFVCVAEHRKTRYFAEIAPLMFRDRFRFSQNTSFAEIPRKCLPHCVARPNAFTPTATRFRSPSAARGACFSVCPIVLRALARSLRSPNVARGVSLPGHKEILFPPGSHRLKRLLLCG